MAAAGGLPSSSHNTETLVHPSSRTLSKTFAAVCRGETNTTDIWVRDPVVCRNRPAVVFSEEEITKLAASLKYTLVVMASHVEKKGRVMTTEKLDGPYEIKGVEAAPPSRGVTRRAAGAPARRVTKRSKEVQGKGKGVLSVEEELTETNEAVSKAYGIVSDAPVDNAEVLPSVIDNQPPGIATTVIRGAGFDKDLAYLHDYSLASTFDKGCNVAVQFLQHYISIFDRAVALEHYSKRGSENKELEINQLKSNLAAKEAEIAAKEKEFQARLQSLDTAKEEEFQARLRKLEADFEKQLLEGCRLGVEKYQSSDEYRERIEQHIRQGIKDFKSSSKGRDWVELRSFDYLTQGFSRCLKQFQEFGHLPEDYDFTFLDLDKPMPTEYRVPPYEDSEDDEE